MNNWTYSYHIGFTAPTLTVRELRQILFEIEDQDSPVQVVEGVDDSDGSVEGVLAVKGCSTVTDSEGQTHAVLSIDPEPHTFWHLRD
jgi:hypothetical protein